MTICFQIFRTIPQSILFKPLLGHPLLSSVSGVWGLHPHLTFLLKGEEKMRRILIWGRKGVAFLLTLIPAQVR
jgi:hypothetical protein